MKTYDVIMPCHDDCLKAEKLKKTLQKWTTQRVLILHNGCIKRNSFSWSNKAKTINYYATQTTKDYLIVIDCDTKVSPGVFKAFEQKMDEGRLFGSAMVVHRDYVNSIADVHYESSICGAFWMIQTKLLRKVKIPEDVVTEDTAYSMILQKRKICNDTITGAVVEVSVIEPTLKKKLKQSIRYNLGGLQLMKKNLGYTYGLSVLSLVLMNIALVAYCIWTRDWIPVVITYGIFFLPVVPRPTKTNKWKWNVQQLDIPFSYLVAPSIALYYFLKKGWVW